VPQGVPGTPSGLYDFSLSNGEVVLEAFSRCQIRATSLTVYHMRDAYRSQNLCLQAWANKGVNLFQQVQGVVQLVVGQGTYLMPDNIVSITDAYYNTILSTGPGPDWDAPVNDWLEPQVSADPQVVITQSQDRWLMPRGRADIAMIPNKQYDGLPTIYWFNRLGPPGQTTLTFWQPPLFGYPQAAVTYFALRQIQDANLANGETPDVANRALDALCADVAFRLARKYAPQLIGAPNTGGLLDDKMESWALFAAEDTEKAEVFIAPRLAAYWKV